MLKWGLNSESINNAGNSIFDMVNRFFTGSSKLQNGVPENDFQSSQDQLNAYTREWELNQDVSDIVIKDIRLSFNILIPSSLIERLSKIQQRIMLYFYIDEMEDDLNAKESSSFSFASLVEPINKRIILFTGTTRNKVTSRVISFLDWWKAFINKLEILLELKEDEPTYYLIGNFTPNTHDRFKSYHDHDARGPDPSKLKSIFPFHKRN